MSPHTDDSKTSRLSKIFSLRRHPTSPTSSNTTETPPPSLSASSIPGPSTPESSTPSTPTPSAQNNSLSDGSLAHSAFIPSLQLDLGQSFDTDAVIAHVEQVKKEREEQARKEKEARDERERAERRERIAEVERRREREREVWAEIEQREAWERDAWERELNAGRRFHAPGVRRREGYRRIGLGGQRRRGF